jgi:hypothetical protein
VLSALQIDNESQFLAAVHLAKAGIEEAKEPITQLLRDHVFERPLDNTTGPKIDSLHLALAKLGTELPEDVRERLAAPDCPKFVSAHFPQADSERQKYYAAHIRSTR